MTDIEVKQLFKQEKTRKNDLILSIAINWMVGWLWFAIAVM